MINSKKGENEMAYRKVLPLLFSLAAVFCLWNAVSSAAAPAQSNADLEKELSNQQRRLDTMQKDIQKAEQRLREAKKKEERAINDISKLGNQLSSAEQKINVTELKRQQVTQKLTETMAKIQEIEPRIDRAKNLLSGRIVAVYKYGGTTEFSLLMSANGTQDALSTSYLLTKIAEQDRVLINTLIMEKNALDKAKAELEKQRRDLDARNKELDNLKKSIQRTSDERNKLLQQARKDKAMFQAEQDELTKSSAELKSKVNDLLAQKKRQGQGGATPLYFKGGRFAWPLRGKINSPFGTRTHPVFKTKATHTGVDIDGSRGDSVRAAADGEVLYTGWLRGYGQVVILDHGGDLTSVYAHLSGIDTMENKKVKTGDMLGRVGSTGITTGPHLHFEVRVNGNAVDPMKYLQ
ncbi:MAG: peptidoglycan DD-metalloendopeptidase family protein [Synergistaceae bacterium]|nr:peptidoglycan DD-metalloendopeptidase family protein [Synergistaceae bacterium]